MPWNSVGFIGTMTSWFNTLSDKTESQTANQIANAYASSAVSASTSFGAAAITLKPSTIISNGFINSFNGAKNIEEGELAITIWTSAASAVVQYWSELSLSILAIPPGGAVGATNNVASAGVPLTLAADLKTAFSQDSAINAATKLNEAFINHLSTIKGTWIGTAPGTPPPAFSFPWAGLT